MEIAIIPARGGSKGIPRKNLSKIGGISLLERAVIAAQQASIDLIIVTSDDSEILEVASNLGVAIHQRSEINSSDLASSESALLEVIEDFGKAWMPEDVIVFLQVTSPFNTGKSIIECVEIAHSGKVGFTAALTHNKYWVKDNESWSPLNHPNTHRERRQDSQITISETGACYAFKLSDFKDLKYRFCGSPVPVLVEFPESLEIDSETDLLQANFFQILMSKGHRTEFIRTSPPRLLVTDFDGCLTNDRVHVNKDGNEFVSVNRKDGLAVHTLRKMGVECLILSSETNDVVQKRAEKMGVQAINGELDKVSALSGFLLKNNIDWSQVWYVGNDRNDAAVMKKVSKSFCPSDAVDSIRELASHILQSRGGGGVLSEIASLMNEGNV
jgi:YrbI family 3-deoxy-D-manno-octulosonate 8-phosphate phosphatase